MFTFYFHFAISNILIASTFCDTHVSRCHHHLSSIPAHIGSRSSHYSKVSSEADILVGKMKLYAKGRLRSAIHDLCLLSN